VAPGYSTYGWLPVSRTTGRPPAPRSTPWCRRQVPDVYFSDNMRKCFGYVDNLVRRHETLLRPVVVIAPSSRQSSRRPDRDTDDPWHRR